MKLAGALCILMGFFGNGMVSFRNLKRRYDGMVYIKQIMQMIKNLTESEKLPFAETCFVCGEKLREDYGQVMLSLYDDLEKGKAPIDQCWEKAIDGISDLAGLEKEDKRVLQRIIPNVSFLSSFSPADSIELVMEEWDKRILNAQEKMKKNGKLSFVLNLSAGCMICLILI